MSIADELAAKRPPPEPMYKLLLIQRYLRRKLAPLFAALAVTLCTAMVIIVISVMGGFLDLLRDAIARMTPQVTVVTQSVGGFDHYQELADQLETLAQVKAATPVIRTLGLVRWHGISTDVDLLGVRPKEADKIVDFRGSLHWRAKMFTHHIEKRLAKAGQATKGGRDAEAPKGAEGSDSTSTMPDYERTLLEQKLKALKKQNFVEDALEFKPNPFWSRVDPDSNEPGAVPGIAVLPYERRDKNGHYMITRNAMGDELAITVVPTSKRGGLLQPVIRQFRIVNEFKSGHYDYDSSLVFLPFDQLQSMLKMDPAPIVNPQTGQPTGKMSRPRANAVFVAGTSKTDLPVLVDAVNQTVRRFAGRYDDLPPLQTQTWIEQNHVLLGAVDNEKKMVTFLFTLISFVAVWMVWLTFYNIVLQKTRDIGVLRAIGASRRGVLSVFLGYGLTLGILGALVGLGLAALIIFNLNEIQALLKATIGWQMWDPRVYAFDHIPEHMDPVECTVIVLCAIASSTVGALIPSVMASSVDPVEALRHE